MIRLFVAIEPPEEVRVLIARLSGGVPGARWVEPSSYHVTLRFIGEVPEDVAEDIHAALETCRSPSFALALGGIGVFSQGRRPGALYLGVDGSRPLHFLRDKVERALVRAGIAPETRKFTPHVTLARLKGAAPEQVHGFAATHNLFRPAPFPVDRFTLFSSHQSRSGAVYTREADYKLEMNAGGSG